MLQLEQSNDSGSVSRHAVMAESISEIPDLHPSEQSSSI